MESYSNTMMARLSHQLRMESAIPGQAPPALVGAEAGVACDCIHLQGLLSEYSTGTWCERMTQEGDSDPPETPRSHARSRADI